MSTTHRGDASAADRLCDEGYRALEAGRFDQAAALLARARAVAPQAPLVHYRLGLLYLDTGRFGEALAAFDTALALDPANLRAHNNRGSALQRQGRMAEAEASFRRALELGPDHVQPYVNLGHLLEAQGRPDDAIRLYQSAIARGLDAELFGHHAAAVAGQVTPRAPERWVRATFDNFAPTFDAHMRSLGYAVPPALVARLRGRGPDDPEVVDLGCGTGQCGVALAGATRRLVGVDLAEKMLAFARAHGVYDELHAAEVHAWLHAAAPASFDVAMAADVLIYIGALEDLFLGVARVLRAGGWFAFSTEECDGDEYTLRPTGRYAQGQAYIRRLAQQAFAVAVADPMFLRVESGRPVAGRLYLLRRR